MFLDPISPPQISWLEEELLQLFTRCLRSKIYCFTLSLLHTNCLTGKKQPLKAVTLSGSVVFVALPGFPWRAATVLTSEKSSETDLETQWLRHPPRPSKPEGLEATLTPHPSSSPTSSSALELAVDPGRTGRRRDRSSRGDRACILSSATPAAAGR